MFQTVKEYEDWYEEYYGNKPTPNMIETFKIRLEQVKNKPEVVVEDTKKKKK